MRQTLLFFIAISAIGTAVLTGNPIADEGAEQELTVEIAREAIVGRWQARDDEASVVVYAADGSAQDVYDDETIGTGTWEIVDNDGTIELRVIIDGLDLDYEVASVLDDYLWLIYLARGNSLHYNRVTD